MCIGAAFQDFNSGVLILKYGTLLTCYQLAILYCTHIEGTLSVQVGLKMAATRPKHVAKNH